MVNAAYEVSQLRFDRRVCISDTIDSKPFGFIGVIFGVAVVIVQMLPGHRPVTAVNMSWSSVSIIGTAVICLITWKLYGESLPPLFHAQLS